MFLEDVLFDGYTLLGRTLKAQLGLTQHYRHSHSPCRVNREIEVLDSHTLGSKVSRSHAVCCDGVLLDHGAIIPKAQHYLFQCLSFPVFKTVHLPVLSSTRGTLARRLIIKCAALRKMPQIKRKTKDAAPS